eukprot:GHRQ01010151.1.p1 GENE.GHRQ01010151.1~~GHRQ01010151.1.p1  ORF type:complete len:591 (+),score=227.22 GHRQ01010151.1:196-1968(+)
MVTTAFIQATGAFLRHGNGAFAAAGQLGAALAFGGQRCFSSMPQTSELKAVLAQKIPTEQARLKSIKKQLGSKSLGEVTVDMCIGGMRGIPGMLWETSLLDAEEGIRFRGFSIPELQAALPSAVEGGEPLPEGLLWLLLTGEVPSKEQVKGVTEDLRRRSVTPPHIQRLLEALPADTHPMTQLVTLVAAMQTESEFARAYASGVHKSRYWEPYYEDTMNLLARLPAIAAMIYRRSYAGGNYIAPDPQLDWAGNLAHMMGYDDKNALELMRLYQTIHSDHEGGNVSAHTTHLVGSALTDPYLSFAAGMCGLAGPLHGLANQEVLTWIMNVRAELGESPSKEQLTKYVQDTLKSGRVVPGYGHAVLRKTDPRYTCQVGADAVIELHCCGQLAWLRACLLACLLLGTSGHPACSVPPVLCLMHAIAGVQVVSLQILAVLPCSAVDLVPSTLHPLCSCCSDTTCIALTLPRLRPASAPLRLAPAPLQREFALKHLPDDPLFKLVSQLYEVVPPVLLATGKVKNPWPNVDAHSGVLLQYYGMREENFYTVLFGVSRAIGVLSQGVWSRALGLPIERPKSLTMEVIEKKFGASPAA